MKRLVLLVLVSTTMLMSIAYGHDGVPAATSGFRQPMDNWAYNGGYHFNDWSSSSTCYHPGADYNGAGTSNDGDLYTDVFAVANGLVVDVSTDDDFGLCVAIEHVYQGTAVYSQYGHLASSLVSEGQTVAKGDHIAELGNSGSAALYAHLHWEIREADHPNPHMACYWDGSLFDYQSNIDNWYEDPEAWCNNHAAYYTYTCAYAGQTAKDANGYYNLHPGDEIELWVKFKNTGTATWYNDPQAHPNDYVELKSCDSLGNVCNSFLYDASLGWVNAQACTTMIQSSRSQGDTALFAFTGKVPSDASLGLHKVYFRPNNSANGGTLMQDWGGMQFPVYVEDPSPIQEYHAKAMVSGDFDNDGKVDDLACIYDYPGSECRIHVWLSDGTEFDYEGPTGWWSVASGYPSENVRHAVCGDFDEDGYKDDIAALYDYGQQPNGSYRSCFHVWKGSGSSFTYQTPQGWWLQDGYDADSVIDLAAGDWDEDGDDDIAGIYNYPGSEVSVHIWLSNGSDAFVYQGSNGWWHLASGYPSENVKFLLSGDWDNDGDDELAAFYDYGWTGSAYRTRIHVWLSGGDTLIYQGAGGWWSYDGYNLDSVTQAVSGDWNNDGKTDIATFYDYGFIQAIQKYRTKIHVWLSATTTFSFQNIWWSVDGYNAQEVIHALPGYFNSDSYCDLTAAYDYSDGDTSRFHVFTSTSSAFTYQGSAGWWYSYGYPLPKLAEDEDQGTLPLVFALNQNYPNPFNPQTVISYSLPQATDVRLDIFNILGQKVQTLVDEHQSAGEHSVLWNSDGFSSSIYLYRLQTAEATVTRKMVLLK